MTRLAVTVEAHTFEVALTLPADGAADILVEVDGVAVAVSVPGWDAPAPELEWLVIGGRPYEIVLDHDLRWIQAGRGQRALSLRDLAGDGQRPLSGDSRVKAPIPGLISRVFVTEGQAVQAGDPLCVLEAMKMENEIRAPRAGTVAVVAVVAGQAVGLNDLLAEIA
jgi:biotin carboxyl carrier protein